MDENTVAARIRDDWKDKAEKEYSMIVADKEIERLTRHASPSTPKPKRKFLWLFG